MTDILDETPPEVLRAVVQNQIQQWKTARVDLVISRRVALTIGDDTKVIDERLVKVEKALLELEKILNDSHADPA